MMILGNKISRRRAIRNGVLGVGLGIGGIASFSQESIGSSPGGLEVQFIETYTGFGQERASSIVQTRNGGYAIAGQTSNSIDGDHFWLVKTDGDGSEEINTTFNNSFNDRGHSIVQTRDGGFAIAGYTTPNDNGEFWLVKTDKEGNEEFTKTFGGSGIENAFSLVQTRDGGLAITGATGTFGNGPADAWLVKTDDQGSEEFSETYGGAGGEAARSIVETREGGFALAGRTDSFGAGGRDFWMVKTDKYGVEEFSRTYGGGEDDRAHAITQTKDGGFAIFGITRSFGSGGWDFWLVKTDKEGVEEFNQDYGARGWDYGYSMVQTRKGGYVLAGATNRDTSNPANVWIVEADKNGKEEYSRIINLGDGRDDRGTSIIQTREGGFALAGHTDNPTRMFLARLQRS